MSYPQQDYSNLRKIVSGDIIVKCRFGNDIRRIPINQAPSYDELCLMMHRLFKKELSNPENIVLKYTDDEGDLVSMTDDTDVNHAISQSSLLKVTVFDKEKHAFIGTTTADPAAAPAYEELKDQMNQLRDMIDHVIGSLTQASKTKSGTINGKVVSSSEATEKTYRNLSTAELAQFLDDERKDQKKTEMQDQKETKPQQPQPPQYQQAPAYPPPPPPVNPPGAMPTSASSQAPTTPYPPPSTTPSAAPAMPRPPMQQQPTTMQSGYPPAQASPVTAPPSYPAPPRPASIPQPGTPQTATSYPPERPAAANDYNNYRVSAPSAPPSTQYYYPPPPPQQQQQQPQPQPPPQQGQRPPVNTAGWR